MSLIKRITGMLRKNRLDQDLEEELRSHIEMRATDNATAGMSPDKARYDAQRRFGNTTLMKEDTRAVDIIEREERAQEHGSPHSLVLRRGRKEGAPCL